MTRPAMLGEVAVDEAAGVVSDLLRKLGRRNGRGKQLFNRVKLLLRDELPEMLPPETEAPIPDWEVWRKVAVGGSPWSRALLWRLWKNDCTMSKGAKTVFLSQEFKDHRYYGHFNQPQQIDLVRVTREDLGIKVDQDNANIGTPIAEVVLAAQKRGLRLCPTDVVPQLHLQYIQPRNTKLLIMTALLPFDSMYGLFESRHDYKGEENLPDLTIKLVSCPFTDGSFGAHSDGLIFWLPQKKEEAKKTR